MTCIPGAIYFAALPPPFCKGNTRATALFFIKYVRTLGFDADNMLFANNSWYFRNALIRANYRNVAKGIEAEHYIFGTLLEKFALWRTSRTAQPPHAG